VASLIGSSGSRPSPARGFVATAVLSTGVAAGSFALGVALVVLANVVGGALGPAVILAIPIVVVAVLAIGSAPWVAPAIVFMAFPVAYVEIPVAGHLQVRLVEVAVAAVTGLVVLHRLNAKRTPLPWSPEMWWGLLFLMWMVVATPSALNGAEAIKQDIDVIAGFLFALTVLASCPTMEDLRRTLGVLLAVGAGLGAIGLRGISSLRATFAGQVGINRAHGVFAHPNDLALFTAMLLMVAIGIALGARSRLVRVFASLTALISLVALAASLSRGAWFGTAAGTVALVVLLPVARRAVTRVALPLFALVALVVGLVLPSPPPQVLVVRERIGTITKPFEDPYDQRPAIWAEAIREIKEDPWTGQGPASFPLASALSGSLSQTVGAEHAHDTLLTVAAETGLPNVLFLIGLTLAVGLTLFRSVRALRDTDDAPLVAGAGAALVALVGQGLVDFTLRNPLLLFLSWTLVGVVLVGGREARKARAR